MYWETLLCEEKKIKKSREEPTENDYRSIFEKDYHRIVTSSSFRRLQDKAQVFPLEKFDFVRTRLTHSIEVASIAKSLGMNLINFICTRSTCKNIKYIPNILECAGLLHDIGNPPFGHFGESAIQDWFRKYLDNIVFDGKKWFIGNDHINPMEFNESNQFYLSEKLSSQQKKDFLHFEGNAQTLRNVMKLNYIIDENSLNLSYALLNTLIKYPVNSTGINKEFVSQKKMGYFFSESEDFLEIVKTTGTFCEKDTIYRHPLTFLIEAADDIVYLTADLEDAFNKDKLKLIDFELLIKQTEYCEDDFCKKVIEKIAFYKNEAKKQEYKNVDMYVIQRLKIYLQGNLLSFVVESFKENYTSIMNGTFNFELLKKSKGAKIVNVLSKLANDYIFSCYEILENEVRGHKIIEGIFNELVLSILNLNNYSNSSSYSEKLYTLISPNYRLVFTKKKNKIESQIADCDLQLTNIVYYKLLLITDFVCGMTDSYAYDFYQKIQSIT